MKAIVNVNQEWGIGRDGDMLCNIPGDMAFFRETTMGKVVIMGRKTLESFPGGLPLKNRINIVLTTDRSHIKKAAFEAAGADRQAGKRTELLTVENPEELENLIAARGFDYADLFVIGGAKVYELLLPECDICYVTKNDVSGNSDAFFPNLDAMPEVFHVTQEGEMQEWNGIRFRFLTYERRQSVK